MKAGELAKWLTAEERQLWNEARRILEAEWDREQADIKQALESLAECREALCQIRDCLCETCMPDSEMVCIINYMINDPHDTTYPYDKLIAGFPREVA